MQGAHGHIPEPPQQNRQNPTNPGTIVAKGVQQSIWNALKKRAEKCTVEA